MSSATQPASASTADSTDGVAKRSTGKRKPLGRGKRWLFRATAAVIGLSLFGVAEAVCIFFDWGRPTDYPDPYVGFREIHPLFVLDETKQKFEIPKSRLGFFAAESFPAEKGAKTFRVFCLGGSTVQGRPYSKPTAFTTWLQLSLTAGDSRRNWEVVNCGGVSYASYRLTPILKECLTHQPDLIILCTGHNEFLEDRSYAHIKHAPKYVTVPLNAVSQLRTFTLLRSALFRAAGRDKSRVSPDRPQLKTKVDALLDYRNGIKAYHRDEKWRAGVIEHYGFNVRRMIRLCQSAGVPVILVLPPSNLRNCPPFKSQHKDGLTKSQQIQWETLSREARQFYRTDWSKAAALFERAISIDGEYAIGHFKLALCYDGLWLKTGDPQWRKRAYQSFLKARELDICPLRMIEPLEESLRRIAIATKTPLIDAHELLESKTPDRILGDNLLVDHIHPTPLRGHQIIAHALAKEMQRQDWFQPNRHWKSRRDDAFTKQVQSLDKLYFPHGKRTLEALHSWAKGRADGPPIENRKP
ncbi:MAG: SGNH/GDSL hydrolase family protein [Planctomycetes bacterium]|nr:SGNH/GDSL hydrolase family protein [Planctomycetota bacterium]